MLWGHRKWSARDDLHVQGCLILSQVGLLFPVNHAPMKMASLTGFAPVISCMRGRHVGWTTPQRLQNGEGKRICTFDLMHVTHPLWLAELCPRKWWGRRVLPSLPLACQTSALLMSYVPENGAGERSCTVVSALAKPYSAVEPHPLEMVSPAGISPATWSLGHLVSSTNSPPRLRTKT